MDQQQIACGGGDGPIADQMHAEEAGRRRAGGIQMRRKGRSEEGRVPHEKKFPPNYNLILITNYPY
jgi:hypothetical protein